MSNKSETAATSVKEIAKRFYYLLDAAGGKSSMTADSKEAEIEDLVGCSKQDFVNALELLKEKGIVEIGQQGVSIKAPLGDKI